MRTTYRFIADPNEPSEVLAWFRSLPRPPEEVEGKGGVWLHFISEGPLSLTGPNGTVDPSQSPLATVFLPRIRRSVLWTVGEVHFLAIRLRQRFPGLHKINSEFAKWLSDHECIYSNKPDFDGKWNYYLEGFVRNYDPPVYAFPSGLRALQAGQYFVAEGDTESQLDVLCTSLKHRGIQCKEV